MKPEAIVRRSPRGIEIIGPSLLIVSCPILAIRTGEVAAGRVGGLSGAGAGHKSRVRPDGSPALRCRHGRYGRVVHNVRFQPMAGSAATH